MAAKYRNPNQKSKGPCKRCQQRRERIERAVEHGVRQAKKIINRIRKGSK